MDIPSGYVLEQPDANAIVQSGVVPEMRDAIASNPGKTIWFFDRVPNETRCFDHTVQMGLALLHTLISNIIRLIPVGTSSFKTRGTIQRLLNLGT